MREHAQALPDGHSLVYAEGPPNGPPVLLIHGLTGWWRSWEAWIPTLVEQWHVLAVDLRGHGSSGRVSGRYRVTDYAADMVAFVNSRTDRPPAIVGISLGALVAIGAAAELGVQVTALVLLDPPLFLRDSSISAVPEQEAWFRWVHQATRTPAANADELLQQLGALYPEAGEAIVAETAAKLAKLAPDTVLAPLEGTLFDDFDIANSLKRVRCRTLLLHGKQSLGSVVREADVQLVKTHVDGIVIRQLAHVGHGLEVDPVALEEVRHFLQEG